MNGLNKAIKLPFVSCSSELYSA